MPDEQNLPGTSPAEPQETPNAAESATPESSATQTPPTQEKPSEPKREPWFQKRIDELTRARREAERRAEALESLIAAGAPAPQNPPPGANTQGTLTEAEILRQAQKLAETQRLNEEANRVYREGKGKYSDFDGAVQQLAQIADLSQKPEFLEAVTRLPNGADVYHHLGTNPDLASEVLSLRGTSLALELAKISAEIGKPKKTTNAPPPITPLGSTASPSTALSDDLPIDEWIRRREASLKNR